MFTVPRRLHALVTLAVIGVTLAAAAISSAAMIVRRPGTTMTVVVKPPIMTAMQSAGSAGIPGYDDERCESLLNDYNTAVNYGDEANVEGDQQGVSTYYNLAHQIYQQLTDNCLVVD